MKHRLKPESNGIQNPAWRPACVRLGEAVAKARTPSDLSDLDKLDLVRLRLFGCIVEDQPPRP